MKYRADVGLEQVQAQWQPQGSQAVRALRLVYPAETATAEAYAKLSSQAALYLNKHQVDLFMDTGAAQGRLPFAAFAGATEEVFLRIAPVTGPSYDIFREHVQPFMPQHTVMSLVGTPVTIETSVKDPVMITLPVPAEITEEQLDLLIVYIRHDDGNVDIKRGKLVELKPGVQGIQLEAEQSSTLSLGYDASQTVAEKRTAPYIQGYPDGTFHPNAPVTRGDMATMLARCLTSDDFPQVAAYSFQDTARHPSRDAIEVVRQAGLFTGTTDTTFDPDGRMTRAQMVMVIANWIEPSYGTETAAENGNSGGQGEAYADVPSTHWAAQAIAQVTARGIMSGDRAGTFHPDRVLTRAEAVAVLNRLFGRRAVEGLTESTFRDVPPGHWAIGEIEAAAVETN